jgi:hypothetical protein
VHSLACISLLENSFIPDLGTDGAHGQELAGIGVRLVIRRGLVRKEPRGNWQRSVGPEEEGHVGRDLVRHRSRQNKTSITQITDFRGDKAGICTLSHQPAAEGQNERGALQIDWVERSGLHVSLSLSLLGRLGWADFGRCASSFTRDIRQSSLRARARSRAFPTAPAGPIEIRFERAAVGRQPTWGRKGWGASSRVLGALAAHAYVHARCFERESVPAILRSGSR